MRSATLMAAAGVLSLLPHASASVQGSEKRIIGTKGGQIAKLQLCRRS